MTSKLNKTQMRKAIKAAAKIKEALNLLRELQAETSGGIKGTFGHFGDEVEIILSHDNDECGLLPFLSRSKPTTQPFTLQPSASASATGDARTMEKQVIAYKVSNHDGSVQITEEITPITSKRKALSFAKSCARVWSGCGLKVTISEVYSDGTTEDVK